MKKRLRKKKFTGEFKVWGWHIKGEFQVETTEQRANEIENAFCDLAESFGLAVLRSCKTTGYWFWITGNKRYDSVSPSQRQELTRLIQEMPEVSSFDEAGIW